MISKTTRGFRLCEYTHLFFRKHEFIIILDNHFISSISIPREAQCGVTRAIATELIGKPVTEDLIRTFGLQICHQHTAHPAGVKCNKMYPGIIS